MSQNIMCVEFWKTSRDKESHGDLRKTNLPKWKWNRSAKFNNTLNAVGAVLQ